MNTRNWIVSILITGLLAALILHGCNAVTDAMKTVFRKLANMMDLSGERGEKLRRAIVADDAGDTVDAVAMDIDRLDDVTNILVETTPEPVTEEPRTQEQNLKELGFDEPATKPYTRPLIGW